MTQNNKPQAGDEVRAEPSAVGAISPDCAVIMVYATFPSLDAAMEVGRALIEARLAGCINILPGMISIYPWEGKIENASETVLIAKTMTSQAGSCMDFIRARHAYDVPAVLAVPVISGSNDYLTWLRAGVDEKS